MLSSSAYFYILLIDNFWRKNKPLLLQQFCNKLIGVVVYYGGDMNREVVFLVKEMPQGGYSARALGYRIFMEISDIAQLHQRVRDAVQGYFREEEPPQAIQLHYLRNETIPV